ncbi:hypothetical protein HWI12_03535 [Staphylococcus epidermidis]|jgi:hypothetical protein|uniref:Phage protein n=1 Tax=Staphylococcus epidermidis TaxID=1282 RepID=A0A8X8G169_STAEP|nr:MULTISPECIES: hypothetical protein [Staphylococcus]EHQ74461.1 hypothetical protein SEVCU041_0378 [Staphylococcus epidermidis VCU041]EHQ76089.1 hypothetical protein SEVCU065_1841 [Staphylococcus epidermidis VCU065]EJE30577.1 hypothetical protein HMPREF9972_08215 [Staphylococcus epidermidis NIH04008]KAB2170479.1 hypothetical protein F9B37_03070 [Staphylococcus epidermidis]KAB2178009.1 hypothetical protein F9B23_00360 [Staphylococcus epidermidis]
MVKIKKKVEMTLPELIEWAWKNGVKEKTFYSNIDRGSVYFDMVQTVSIEYSIVVDETFTVEVEEEVTEETKIPEMLEIFVNGGGVKRVEKSINELKDDFSKEFWLKDGDTMTLIWKDGELVGDE